jgi:hypothetical protein
MIDFNPLGKKTVLTLDGGGMRGVISIAMLAELEKATGKPAYELFDLVVGNSTGSIIAAALGIHMTAEEILNVIYKDKLPKAFPARNIFLYLRYLFGGLRHLYPPEPFQVALQPFVQGKKIRDFSKPIVMMTVKDMRTSNNYFVVSAGPGSAAFADWPVAGAVAASSSAPIYFPPVDGGLIDGGAGIYANPCLAGAVEAIEYIQFMEENTMLVSLGTGYQSTETNDAPNYWLKNWVIYLIVEGLDDAALQQVYDTRAIYKNLDFRRYNPGLSRENIVNVLGVPLDSVRPEELSIDSIDPKQIAVMEQVGRAYAQKLDWTKPNVLPWETIGGHPQPGIQPVDWSKTPYR